jgi:hypothetical protein
MSVEGPKGDLADPSGLLKADVGEAASFYASALLFYFLRGSSAGSMNTMPPGPVNTIWTIVSSFVVQT